VRAFALVVGLLLFCGAAHSEADVLLRAVGFALTGSDDADPKVIGNRANCVFAIKNNVYHLNNVHYDRIRFKAWQRQSSYGLEKSITVELHGDDVVFEETIKPVWGEGLDPDSIQRLQAVRPDFFQSHHYTYRQLRLDTGDMDRVKGAWQYIYSHGCTGKKSPF
jgi:phenylpropionate dioxygenase-like ring-hydroxylating dioxygenase large terminal subunit